jgi:hypothetical protein
MRLGDWREVEGRWWEYGSGLVYIRVRERLKGWLLLCVGTRHAREVKDSNGEGAQLR